jgi:putative flippase GtrA
MIKILKEKVNFFLVGVVNTIITYLLYISLLELKLNYLISFTMSWIFGFIFSFYMNLRYVFKKKYHKKNQLKKKSLNFLHLV